MYKSLIPTIGLVLLLAATIYSDIPRVISYQGRLTDSSGEPVADGSYSVTFTIWKHETSTDPVDSLWSTGSQPVGVENGHFTYQIGAEAPLPDDVLDGSTLTWLGITVGPDAEILPRTRLASVPYAFHALSSVASRKVVGDIWTAPGVLQVHSPDDCVPPDSCEPAFEMIAEPDNNIIRIHPPDPCVPPEACGPAVELIADVETNALKLYPPDPPDEQPAFKVVSDPFGDYSLMRLQAPSPSDTDPMPWIEMAADAGGHGEFSAGIVTGLEDGENSYNTIAEVNGDGWATTGTSWSGVSDSAWTRSESGEGWSRLTATSWARVTSGLWAQVVATQDTARIGTQTWGEVTSASWAGVQSGWGWGRSDVRIERDDGQITSVAMEVDEYVSQLTLSNGDPLVPPDIIVRSTTDNGGQVGINTDSPAEALDVNGTTQTTGFKMPTGAVSGHVLTSDDDGNGTWQALGSMVGHAQNVNTTTDASGNVTLTYPGGLFNSTPSLSVTAQFNSGGVAQMGWVTVSGHTQSGFTLNVKDGTGSNWSAGTVQISYTAIGR